MTLIFTDGFETYANINDMAARYTNRVASAAGNGSTPVASLTFPAGRFGLGTALRLQSSASSTSGGWSTQMTVDAPLPTDYQTLFVGFAFQLGSVGTSNAAQVWLVDANNTVNIDVRYTSSPTLYLTRAGTTLCTAPKAFNTGAWTYVEIAANISSTAGWCELWQDGLKVASYYGTGSTRATANGNTQNGLASVRTIRVGNTASGGTGTSGSFDTYFDDFYVCSSAGARNNDVLGDLRIATLLPTGASTDGAGHTQFTRGGSSPAATNWQSVDEATYNQDVDYVADNTIGHVDTYAYADLPAAANVVLGVVAQPVARKDDAGMRQIQAVVRQGGTDAYSAGVQNLTANYIAGQLVMETNPVTGLPWTVSDVNADEFGVRISA